MPNSTYTNRKKAGLCVKCGGKMDGDGSTCSSCRKKTNSYVSETRKWFQDHGICPRCRKNKLYGDEKNCPECSAYAYSINVAIIKRDKERYNEKHRIWSKRTHHEMIEKGICPRCRKRKADNGYKTCGICREKTRNYKREKYGKEDRKERVNRGLCYFCDNPIKAGYKVCDKHYNMNLEKSRSQKANEARRKMIEGRVLY